MTKEQRHRYYEKYKQNPDWVKKNRERSREYAKKNRKKMCTYRKSRYHSDSKFRAGVKAAVKKWNQKMRALWYDDVKYNTRFNKMELVDISEKTATEIILPKEGFKNIIPTSHNLVSGNKFPFFDVLAEKDNKKYGINITTSWMVPIHSKKGLSIFLKFLDMYYLVVMIKPNLTGYIMREIDRDEIPSGLVISHKLLKQLKLI